MPTVPAESIPAIALECDNRGEVMAQTGIGKDAATAILKTTAMTLDEFQDKQRGQLQSILDELAVKIRQELDDLSAAQKAVTYGILSDKLANQPKQLTQNLHLHIKGDASSALSAILGPAAQSVFRPSAQPGNISEPVKIQPGKGESIDVETAQQA